LLLSSGNAPFRLEGHRRKNSTVKFGKTTAKCMLHFVLSVKHSQSEKFWPLLFL
jgi:hypothetical protein